MSSKKSYVLLGCFLPILLGIILTSKITITAESYDKTYNFQNVISTAFTDTYLTIRNQSGETDTK